MNPRVVTQALSGNALTAAVMSGAVPADWYERVPADPEAWRQRVETVRAAASEGWLEKLAPAFEATGKAKERLDSVAGGRGVVVTTGQQPGLFGGPIYTLSKALSALALADSLQAVTGVPVAPVFWAATDDTDFKEASTTLVATTGGAQLLRIEHVEALGRTMSTMPLGDVSTQLEALVVAAGPAIDPQPLQLLERTYDAKHTVGSAFVSFLRALLAPLGIAVLDASHQAARAAARTTLDDALRNSQEISGRIAQRNKEIEAAGFEPQVQDVVGLSLVFTSVSGSRKRIPIKAATKHATNDDLGPNVLLRPVVERAILPTATYVGGPAEIAYFAQVSPIAEILDVPRPVIVPRWSCVIIEPHVEKILEKLYLLPEDLKDPHEAEARFARSKLSAEVLEQLEATRAVLHDQLEALTRAINAGDISVAPSVTGGLHANLVRRIDRFERRLIAASKKQHSDVMREIATARGSLYPMGKPQERALSFVPMLARYGPELRNDMLEEAGRHAGAIIGSDLTTTAPLEAVSARERS
jgi:bacillithiol biosynthesis cysteine-adding enzyme BshC